MHGEMMLGVTATLAASVLTSGAMVFAQVADAGSADLVSGVIPAAALTTTSGALVWVVRQIVGGKLVHRDPAEATAKLAEALKTAVDQADKSAERERAYLELLTRRPFRPTGDTHD